MGFNQTTVAFLAVLALGTGCTSDDLQSAAGHYEGFEVVDGTAGPAQSSIGGDLQIASNGTIEVSIATEPSSGQPTTFSGTLSGQTLALSSPSGLLPKPLTLASGPNGCYTDAAGDQLCFDGAELRVLIVTAPASGSTPESTIKFVLDRMDPAGGTPSPTPSPLAPGPYSVDQLVSTAQTRNFNTQVQFDSVIQAKLNAQESYLNLLPHLNFGSGLDLIGFVTETMVRAIGDLLPFILPDRWFEASAANHAAAAEWDSYRIVQADGMNVVQGLAYSVLRDEQALLAMEQNRAAITQVRDEVLAAEENGSGTVQIGASGEITAVINTVVGGIDEMQETIAEEKTALAQAAGFADPQAVTAVIPVALPDMSGPLPGALSDYETAATNRSLELLQIDDMVEYAQDMKKAGYFQWLDPTGSDSGSLGFGLIDSLKIDSSQIQQLYDQKSGTQASLLQQVSDALSSSSELVQQYQLAVQASQLAETQVERLLLDFRTGVQFDMGDLATNLQDKTTGDIGQINGQYAYLILEAQMDFLTYSGPYANLLTETEPGTSQPAPTPSPSPSP